MRHYPSLMTLQRHVTVEEHTSLASRNLALVIWVGVCSSGGGLSALGRFKSTQFESVLSEWTMVLSKWFQAISVAVPHSVASVIPDVVFSQVTGHKVC